MFYLERTLNLSAKRSSPAQHEAESRATRAMNPNDVLRDHILRFLYERHSTARGVKAILIGIKELQSGLKKQYGMSQAAVAANLDYRIQAGWVTENVKDRKFKTPQGVEVSSEQVKYKISDVGINHLEAGTTFSSTRTSRAINITNVAGVTIVGDGNERWPRFSRQFSRSR